MLCKCILACPRGRLFSNRDLFNGGGASAGWQMLCIEKQEHAGVRQGCKQWKRSEGKGIR